MTVSNLIVGVCCVLAFGSIAWAVINEFKPESKDETSESIKDEEGEKEHE